MKKILLSTAAAVLAIGAANAQDNATQVVNVTVAPMVAIDFVPPGTPGVGNGDPVSTSFTSQNDMWSGKEIEGGNIRVQSTAAWTISAASSGWAGPNAAGTTLQLRCENGYGANGYDAYKTLTNGDQVAGGSYGPSQNMGVDYKVIMNPALQWAQAGTYTTTVTYTASVAP